MTKKKKTGKGVIYFDHPVKTRFFVTEEERAKWAKDKPSTYEGRTEFMFSNFIQDHCFVEVVRKLSKTQIEDELGVQASWGEYWSLGS